MSSNRQVGLERGGPLSYRAMLLWSVWSVLLLLLFSPLEAAEKDDLRAGGDFTYSLTKCIKLTEHFLLDFINDLLLVCIITCSGCSTSVNDLVYIVDGSWSVGVPDFETAKQWLINITSQFDISSYYTQVGMKTEFMTTFITIISLYPDRTEDSSCCLSLASV